MDTHGSSALPPQPPPKESLARRYKFLWPLLVAVNLAVGAYLFVRTKKKVEHIEEEVQLQFQSPLQKLLIFLKKPYPRRLSQNL
nr:hypothetical protein CFP56_48566 [Quercus suber]